MDTKNIQSKLEQLGLLTPGGYTVGVLDTKTKNAINLVKKVSGSDDISESIAYYSRKMSEPNTTNNLPTYKPRYAVSKDKQYLSANKIPSSKLSSTRSSGRRGSLTYDKIECYIVNLRSGDTIDFSLESPPEIRESTKASIESVTTKGRSHPFLSYDSSGGKEVSFSISLFDDYCDGGIKHVTHLLKKLTLPYAKGSKVVLPESLLKLGSTINIKKCVVNSVEITWKKPYKNGIYASADVDISVTEISDVNMTQSVVSKEW